LYISKNATLLSEWKLWFVDHSDFIIALRQEWLVKEYYIDPRVTCEIILYWAKSNLGKNIALSYDWLVKECYIELGVTCERILHRSRSALGKNITLSQEWLVKEYYIKSGLTWENIAL